MIIYILSVSLFFFFHLDDWECHFLIRILRNQFPLQPLFLGHLSALLRKLTEAEPKVCNCHGIERIIRILIENNTETPSSSLASLLVSYVLNHIETCTQKEYSYKALFWISCYIHEKSIQFRLLLRSHPETDEPWYILTCYQIAWECRNPSILCSTGVCLECPGTDSEALFHCLEDKDTDIMTALCLIADLSLWKRENGDHSHLDLYNCTFMFMMRTDCDPDVVISFLNESTSILKFFITLCKVLEWDYRVGITHEFSSIEQKRTSLRSCYSSISEKFDDYIGRRRTS